MYISQLYLLISARIFYFRTAVHRIMQDTLDPWLLMSTGPLSMEEYLPILPAVKAQMAR